MFHSLEKVSYHAVSIVIILFFLLLNHEKLGNLLVLLQELGYELSLQVLSAVLADWGVRHNLEIVFLLLRHKV